MEYSRKKTVLIVEDEDDLAHAMKAKLLGEGFAVVTARTGDAGLREALENKPDFILLDIVMPNMSGIEMLEELRKDSWGSNAPVVVLTNLENKEARQRAIDLDVLEYCVKDETKLAEIVKKIHAKLG